MSERIILVGADDVYRGGSMIQSAMEMFQDSSRYLQQSLDLHTSTMRELIEALQLFSETSKIDQPVKEDTDANHSS